MALEMRDTAIEVDDGMIKKTPVRTSKSPSFHESPVKSHLYSESAGWSQSAFDHTVYVDTILDR